MNQVNVKTSSSTGRRYSVDGNSKNRSAIYTNAEFFRRQHCFIHQYDMFREDKYQVRICYFKVLTLINLHFMEIIVKIEIIVNFQQHFLILIILYSPAALPHPLSGADLECKTRWWLIFVKLILFILQLLLLFLLLLLLWLLL